MRTKLIVLSWVLLSVSFIAGETIAQSNKEKLEGAIKMLKEEALKLGEPKVEGANLFFGTIRMNGNYKIVDAVKEKFNCTATFFVKRGDGYMRISTNVVKDDGNRAIGTVLDPKGKAIAAISKSKSFVGEVDILGRMYDTIYEPIKNADGETIGVYYVGILK